MYIYMHKVNSWHYKQILKGQPPPVLRHETRFDCKHSKVFLLKLLRNHAANNETQEVLLESRYVRDVRKPPNQTNKPLCIV